MGDPETSNALMKELCRSSQETGFHILDKTQEPDDLRAGHLLEASH